MRHRCRSAGDWFSLVGLVVVVLLLPLRLPPLRAATVVSKHILPNGLTVLIKENPTSDLLVVEVLARAGARVEEAMEAGISFFVLGTLLRGTERRSAAEIALAVENVGGNLRATASTDHIELATLTPVRHIDAALDALADLVTAAKFDPVDIETQRLVSLSRIRQQADQPLGRALDLMASRLYAFHPYRQPLAGTAESVSALTREHLVNFYRTIYTAPNMVVVVVGNVQTPLVLEKVRQAFGSLRTDPVPRRVRLLPVVERALAPRSSQRQEVREVRQTTAAWVALGYLGVAVGHRDWAPLRVLSGMLGEGFSSRLFVEIREKQGLAYQVGASFPVRAGPSAVTLFAGTDPTNVARLIAGMEGEVTKLQKALPSAGELELAKQRIIGSHVIDHEDLQRQAFLLGWYELLGVGVAFDSRLPELIAAVSAKDVQRVARTYLQHPIIAVIEPPAKPSAATTIAARNAQ